MVKELDGVACRDGVLEIKDHDLCSEGGDNGNELVWRTEDCADATKGPRGWISECRERGKKGLTSGEEDRYPRGRR